jgi:predicted house-cleaning NTP pyrophosphatase (Maf/HAM1 superfamily)
MTIIDLGAVRAAAVILASASPRRVDILNNVLGALPGNLLTPGRSILTAQTELDSTPPVQVSR